MSSGTVVSWVKIIDNRDIYAIEIDRIGAFCSAPNGKITFWLPDSGIPIIINPKGNPESYYKVQEYIRQIGGYSLGTNWIKFSYDREEYVIDINRISAFSWEQNSKKLTFWLPDSKSQIVSRDAHRVGALGHDLVLHPRSNKDAYEKVLEYIEKTTGHSLD